MMGRIAYGLFLGAAILLAVGTALAQGMQTFENEQAAQQHCPSDTVVWLNISSANYHFKGGTCTVARNAVITSARLRPTKPVCARRQVQNECLWQGRAQFRSQAIAGAPAARAALYRLSQPQAHGGGGLRQYDGGLYQ